MQHIPFVCFVVRGYGLYAGCKHAELNVARERLAQGPLTAAPEPLSWQDFCVRLGRPEQAYCPVCGEELQLLATVACGARPPPWPDQSASLGVEHEAA